MNTSDTGAALPREQRISAAFMELADTQVVDFDLPGFLHRLTWHCVDLLPVAGAGVMLAGPDGRLQLLASSSERIRSLELFELGDTGLRDAEGPCLAAYRSGAAVADIDLDAADPRWALFAARAHEVGLRSVHALPMRLQQHTIGVLNLFATGIGPLPRTDQELGRALADVATIGLRHHHLVENQAHQLQGAFTARLDIEQATGLLAEHLGIGVPEAFQRLRAHARATHRRMAELAHDVLTGRVTLPRDDSPQQSGAATYAHRAKESAGAAARDAHRSRQAAAQAQQDARAAQQRLHTSHRLDPYSGSPHDPG